jgi:hypothetical protein
MGSVSDAVVPLPGEPGTHGLSEAQAQRQASTHALEPPRRTGVRLEEGLANLPQDLGLHAGSRIFDNRGNAVRHALSRHFDETARIGELDPVRNQIVEDPAKCPTIGQYEWQALFLDGKRECDRLFHGQRASGIHRMMQHREKVEPPHAQGSVFEPCQVDQIVHRCQETPAAALDMSERRALFGPGIGCKQIGKPKDGRQRSAQFVAQIGEELHLDPLRCVGADRLFDEPLAGPPLVMNQERDAEDGGNGQGTVSRADDSIGVHSWNKEADDHQYRSQRGKPPDSMRIAVKHRCTD